MSPPLYSHPGKPLREHLEEVGEAATIIAGLHSLDNEAQARLNELVRLHDFGKATRFFQDYITYQPAPYKWPGNQADKTHTPLGMFASAVIKVREGLSDVWLRPDRHERARSPYAVTDAGRY